MLASFDRNFLYFHVPKTGGTSIRAALERYATKPQRFWFNRVLNATGISVNHYCGGYRNYQFRLHQQARTVRDRIPQSVYDSIFKFCFVRNPWDLMYSHFNFISSNTTHKRHEIVNRMGFANFIEYAIEKQIGFQFMRISDDRDNLLVDFVGRFEQLQEDFEKVARRLKLDVKLPHKNRYDHASYVEAYDATTARRVREAYARDIEQFGYEFG